MTDAELTILSLLAEGPRFGHEVQRLIDERGLREWVSVGFSSVYYILNRLEGRNLLSSELRVSDRPPARKFYRLTEAGRGVLQTAVADLLRQPRSLGTGFELGLANLAVLKPRQVYQVLLQHRADLAQRLDAVRASWGRQTQDDTPPVHIDALYTHSIALMEAELAWLDDFLADWKRRYPAVLEPDPLAKVGSESGKPTRHHRYTSSPDKMIQRLKRLRPKDPPSSE